MTGTGSIIRQAPTAPGVYLMKNSRGKILYVGKAKHLKKRVASYFTPNSSDNRYQIHDLLNEVGIV